MNAERVRPWLLPCAALALLLAGGLIPGAASAPVLTDAQLAAFPTRAITLVVTFPPGGGTDLLARRIGSHLQEDLGRPVIVENKPGASGNIGAAAVANAAPDGHTLLMVNSSFAINPGVFRSLGFSPKQDFAAVVNVAFVPSVIVVPASSTAQTLADALAQARADRPVSYASCGNGTPQHLAGEMLGLASGAALQQIPYRGCGPALSDLMAAQVGLGIVTASSAAPLLKAGKLRALAVTAPRRSPLMAGVPTVAEQGFKGYELDQWHGLLAPAATPAKLVAKINESVVRIMQRPEVRRDLLELGFSPTASSPQAFEQLIHGDIDRFGALTARIGLSAD